MTELTKQPVTSLVDGDVLMLVRTVNNTPLMFQLPAEKIMSLFADEYAKDTAQQINSDFAATISSAQNAVSGVTANASAAQVLLTAAQSGAAVGNFKGYWDATQNKPVLTDDSGAEGDLYLVSVEGTSELGGHGQWSVGDAAWFHNGAWQYYARAGWAAVAQTLTGLSAVSAGKSTIRTPGSNRWAAAWLDDFGGVIAGVLSDGSPQFPGAQALIGPTHVETSNIAGTGIVSLDSSGRIIGNTSSLTWPNAIIPGRGDVAPNVGERAPGYLDDNVVGYQENDIWQNDGTLYTCIRNGAGGAVWGLTDDVAPACPGDVFGSDLVGAWGIDAMVAGFTGPSFDVTTTVSGAQVVTTVNIVPGGTHDAGVLSRAIVQRDAGTTAEVTKFYDQSGNGFHLTGDYGKCPKVGVVNVNGFAAISFDTCGASVVRGLSNTALSVASGTFTALAFGRYAGTNAASDDHIQLLTVGAISTVSGVKEDGKLGVYDGVNYIGGTQYQPCNPSMMGISAAGGTSVSVWVGEKSNAVTVAASALSGTMTGFTLGSSGLSAESNGVLTGAVVAKRGATAADIQSANRSASLRWNYIPQAKPRIWCVGDSRTAGWINTDCQNWPGMLGDYLKQPAEVFNLAVAGSMTVDFIPNTQPGLLAELEEGGYNLAIVWIGVNDFKASLDKPTTMKNIQEITSALLAAGARHVFLLSEFYPGDQTWFWQYFPNGQHPNITLLTPFLANYPIAFQGNTDTSPLLWHSDNLHPMPPTDRTLASVVASAINSFVAQDLDA